MKRWQFTRAFLVVSAALPGLAPGAAADDPAPSVKAGNAAYLDALVKGDSRAMGRLFTDDGLVLPENGPIVRGRAAVEKFFAPGDGPRIVGGEIVTIELHRSGDLVYEIGHFRFDLKSASGPDPKPLSGRYLTLWRLGPDGWRICVDSGQSGAPPT